MIAGVSRDAKGRCAQTVNSLFEEHTPKSHICCEVLGIPFLGSNYGGYLGVSDVLRTGGTKAKADRYRARN